MSLQGGVSVLTAKLGNPDTRLQAQEGLLTLAARGQDVSSAAEPIVRQCLFSPAGTTPTVLSLALDVLTVAPSHRFWVDELSVLVETLQRTSSEAALIALLKLPSLPHSARQHVALNATTPILTTLAKDPSLTARRAAGSAAAALALSSPPLSAAVSDGLNLSPLTDTHVVAIRNAVERLVHGLLSATLADSDQLAVHVLSILCEHIHAADALERPSLLDAALCASARSVSAVLVPSVLQLDSPPCQPDERKPDEPKPEEPKPDEPKPDEPKPDEPKPDEPSVVPAGKPADAPVDKPAKPAADKLGADKLAADKPADAAVDEPAADKPAADKPADVAADKPAVDKPVDAPVDKLGAATASKPVATGAALDAELAELRESEPLFRRLDERLQAAVFIAPRAGGPSVSSIVEAALRQARATGHAGAAHCHRMVPVHATCHADVPAVTRAATRVIRAHFLVAPARFAIVFRARNNSVAKRDAYIGPIADAVVEVDARYTVDLEKPDVVLIVEIIKTAACVGAFSKFYQLAKLNLQEAACPSEKPDAKKKAQPKAEEAAEAKGEGAVEGDVTKDGKNGAGTNAAEVGKSGNDGEVEADKNVEDEKVDEKAEVQGKEGAKTGSEVDVTAPANEGGDQAPEKEVVDVSKALAAER